jgi:hypothetical protein
VRGDAWVAGSLLEALAACAAAAARTGAAERGRVVWAAATTVARQARDEAGSDRDRDRVDALLQEVEASGRQARGARRR